MSNDSDTSSASDRSRRSRQEPHRRHPRDQLPNRLSETPFSRTYQFKSAWRYNTWFPDPLLLTNGEDPLFNSWLIGLDSKLEASGYHDPSVSKRERMSYVLSRTADQARTMLEARFPSKILKVHRPFKNVEQILRTLASAFVDEFEVTRKKDEYSQLVITETQTVQEFKANFLILATQARISHQDYFHDFRSKLSYRMRVQLAAHMYDISGSFTRLCATAEQADLELRDAATRWLVKQVTQPQSLSTPKSRSNRPLYDTIFAP